MRENAPLDDRIDKALKIFGGIPELTNAATLPPDLEPEKRGMIVCLTIGTLGIGVLGYFKAEWWTLVAEIVLTVTIAILIGCKRKK